MCEININIQVWGKKTFIDLKFFVFLSVFGSHTASTSETKPTAMIFISGTSRMCSL